MKSLPKTKNALVLRTDFSNDAVWESLCATINEPVTVFTGYTDLKYQAHVDCISDPEYAGLTVEQLVALVPEGFPYFVFVVDRIAMTHPEHPILIVDMIDEPGRTFRVVPCQMWDVENSLSTADMVFDEFADNTDPDGIFRGFPED